jgi:hypothetical protein
MNTIPRLFLDPSWETIRNMSGSELFELAMLGVLSVGLVAAVLCGLGLWLFRRKRTGED